jgi:hypothetical protein
MNEFTNEDRDKLASTHQSLEDLKANMPILLEVAASRGADMALEKHAPLLDNLFGRVNVIEVQQGRVDSLIKTIKWVTTTIIAVGSLVIAFATKILSKVIGH